MIKVNKNVLTFSIIVLIAGSFLVLLLQKISPLLSHTVYYCQSYINSISIPIPSLIKLIPFVLLFSFFLFAFGKVLIVLLRVKMLKKWLIKNTTSQKQFNSLLSTLNLQEKTFLVKSDNPFAFCLGILNPKIYISTAVVSLMDRTELEAILRHEKYHVEHRDTFVMLLASIGESLLPFFPLLSDLLRNYRIEREVEADQEAIKELGKSTPIISVLRKLLTTPSFATVPISAIADQDTLEPRIKAIVKKDFKFKRYRVKNMVISLGSVVIFLSLLIAPVHAFDFHDAKNDVMMLCPYGDSCAQWCRDNNTVIPQYSSMSENSSSQQYSTFHK